MGRPARCPSPPRGVEERAQGLMATWKGTHEEDGKACLLSARLVATMHRSASQATEHDTCR